MEGRGRRIKEPQEGTMAGAPMPRPISTKQARIAKLAKQMPEARIRSLSYHVDLEWMREAYRRTNKHGAAGVDGVRASDVNGGVKPRLFGEDRGEAHR